MKSFTTLILVTMTVAAAATGSVTLFDFSKTGATAWKELNDPVMGGKSTGTFTVANGVGVFDGEVVNVPALKAPGFIKAELSGSLFSPMHFPDVRHCSAIEIVATSTTAFAGYRFSFGSKNSLGCSFFSNGFKAHFDAPMTGGNAASVVIPFANFTDCNSDSTGKPIAGKTCADDTKYCPDQGTLQDMKEMAIWAEGAAGKVHLEIHSVNAVGCATPAATGDYCAKTEYCCPDAKHCLTPTNVTCAADAGACSADQTCCPLTKLCVAVGKPCKSPCAEGNTYCCPDALACLEPTHPGVLCAGASDCASGEVCCPLTKICVKPHEKCQPLVAAPVFMQKQ